MYIIKEYAGCGDLQDYIGKFHKLDEREACRFFHSIVSVLAYLHENKIAYRNLEAEHILLDENFEIKLPNFRSAAIFSEDQLLKTPWKNMKYMAPEVWDGNYSGPPVDMWAAGVLLYFMLCGYHPFESLSVRKFQNMVQSADFTMPRNFSLNAKGLIQGLLTVNPSLRMTWHHIQVHPWFQMFSSPEMTTSLEVDDEVLQAMSNQSYDIDFLTLWISKNRNNNSTTTYYLMKKKKSRERKISDFSLPRGQSHNRLGSLDFALCQMKPQRPQRPSSPPAVKSVHNPRSSYYLRACPPKRPNFTQPSLMSPRKRSRRVIRTVEEVKQTPNTSEASDNSRRASPRPTRFFRTPKEQIG